MHYLEIVKYLNQEEFMKNPPEFKNKLQIMENLSSVINFKTFFTLEESNKKLFLTYVMVSFNWVMKSVLDGNPDMGALANLQFKVSEVRGLFDNELMNQYIEMIHIFLSSIGMYFFDKSSEALVEFNESIGQLMLTVSKWWTHDYKEEYMRSKAPKNFLEVENSCSCTECACGTNEESKCQKK